MLLYLVILLLVTLAIASSKLQSGHAAIKGQHLVKRMEDTPIFHTDNRACICDECHLKRENSGPIRFERPSEYMHNALTDDVCSLCMQFNDAATSLLENTANRQRDRLLRRKRQISINAAQKARYERERKQHSQDYELMSSSSDEGVSSRNDQMDTFDENQWEWDGTRGKEKSEDYKPIFVSPKLQKMHLPNRSSS